jgi:hypothetical protein
MFAEDREQKQASQYRRRSYHWGWQTRRNQYERKNQGAGNEWRRRDPERYPP